MKHKPSYYYERICSILVAIILLQTLFYKFTAAKESVFIFSQLHIEPWGRILTGVLELITGSLLVLRRTSIYGAILGLGIISGALLSHILVLGVEVQGDHGKLFSLALIVFIGCIIILILRRHEVKKLISLIFH